MRSGILRGLAAVGVCLTGVAMSSPAAIADTVPFTDPNAHGYIGLCDSAGHSIKSGLLSEKPFVVRAVSSAPAPAGYREKQGAKTSLYAYQPINGIDPGDWSGQQMNGSSFFSNDLHPMAQGTVLDYSMSDFVELYPPKWDNLVQLRLFYGAPNKPAYIDEYPATVLKIEGKTWRVVQGGKADCKAGKAVSTETLMLPKDRFASASASIAAAGGATLGGVTHRTSSGGGGGRSSTDTGHGGPGSGNPDEAASGAGALASGSASPGSGGASTDASISPAAAAADRSDNSSSSVWLVIAIIAGIGVVVAAGAWTVRRRTGP